MSSPSTWTVESFLATIGVDNSDVDAAAEALMDAGYKTERYLLSARSEHLEKVGVPFPVIDLILAHQEKVAQQQQRQHQQQVAAVPEEYKQLAAFAKEELDNRTKHKPMSEASMTFAEAILDGFGFRYSVDPIVKEPGSTADPPAYSWKVVDKDAVVWKKGEHSGTAGARDWAHTHLLGGDETFGLKVVSGALLPMVKANRRSASGKGDMAIGNAEDMKLGEEYLFANGLIELKTDEYPLKTGQNLLELLALSKISRFGTGVALLATDCNTKWETFHFSGSRAIRRKIYKHGRKAWEDFMHLLKSPENRLFAEKTALEAFDEDDQNLDGFDLNNHDKKKFKAAEDHAVLERLADRLSDIYGERPIIPLWAHAEARVPNYYA